jgi:hypothetical protein
MNPGTTRRAGPGPGRNPWIRSPSSTREPEVNPDGVRTWPSIRVVTRKPWRHSRWVLACLQPAPLLSRRSCAQAHRREPIPQ